MFCQKADSVHHRHWECSFFEDLREACLSKIVGDIRTFPDCLLLHGWLPSNPFVDPLKALLQDLPDNAHVHFIPNDWDQHTDIIEVFPDGHA